MSWSWPDEGAQASAVLVFPDALFTDVRGRLAGLSFVEAVGLMSYGSSRTDAFREVGIYVGRILRGEKSTCTGGIRVTGCHGIQVEPGTGLVCLDAGRSDHLSPFFCFFGDELSEINRRARDLNAAQIS
jgi:hypothetical protein